MKYGRLSLSERVGSAMWLALIRSHPGNVCFATKEIQVGDDGGSNRRDST